MPRWPSALPASSLTSLTIAVGFAWTVVGALAHGHYRASLVARLHDGTDRSTDYVDATGQLIVSPDAVQVARGLDRLQARADPAYGLHLLEMTSGRHPAVRALAIGRLGEIRVPTAERIVAVALDDHSPEVRSAAVAARHRSGIIGQAELIRAMADPDPRVAAVAAASAIDRGADGLADRALEVLVGALTDTSGAAEQRVVETLAATGDLPVSFLQRALIATTEPGPTLSPGRLEAVVSLATTARYREPERAAAALLPHVPATNPRLAVAVTAGLVAAGHRACGPHRNAVRSILVDELAFGRSVITALGGLAATTRGLSQPQPVGDLIAALFDELEHGGERIWTVLALLHGSETIEQSKARLRHTDGAKAALAAEALEVILDPDIRHQVKAVVWDLPLERRARLVTASPPAPGPEVVSGVRSIADDPRAANGCRLRAGIELVGGALGVGANHGENGASGRAQPSRPATPAGAGQHRAP